MPIYEYECQKCHHRFEKIQGFSDDPLTICPECGQESLEKCISPPNFHLKGKGWYETDFKKNKSEGKKESTKASGGCSCCPHAHKHQGGKKDE